MLIEKILARRGYLAAAGNGEDDSAYEQNFDESVLDNETGDLDGSNFKGEEDPNDTPDDPDREPKPAPKKPVIAAADQPGDKPAGEEDPDKKEGEEDPDKTLSAAATPKPEDKPRKGIIPVERHEQILKAVREERDEIARALANAQGGTAIAKVNTEISALEAKVDGLQQKYDDALIDGDKEAAKLAARELRTVERDLNDKKTEIAVGIARAEAIEEVRFDTAKERIEAAYAQLRPGSEEYDQAVVDEVVNLSQILQRGGGFTSSDALQKATRMICGKAETAAQRDATTVKPRVTDADVDADKKLADERKANAVDKALKLKQPADTSTVGIDHDKLGKTKTARDVMKMTDKEFDALTDEELAKMGGDSRLVAENEDR